jgi:hypothetical protein
VKITKSQLRRIIREAIGAYSAPALDPSEMIVDPPFEKPEEAWYILNPEGKRIGGPYRSKGVAQTELKYEPDGVKVSQ